MPPTQSIREAQQLARAVKEEAMAGEHTPTFLLIQLSAAVEQLATAVLQQFPDAEPKNVPALSVPRTTKKGDVA
jgi:hypothetical protein